jgi:hypothetical protein
MQASWTIAGEAGQSWDETQQTLEYRSVTNANIEFRSLEADELNLTVVVEDATSEIFVATPTVSPDSSVVVGASINVVVSCETAGATLRFTTDGSNPTGASPTVISGDTLTISNPSTLKVQASKSGLLASDIKVAQYVLEGVVASGGSVSDVGGFRTHTFLSSDSFVVTNGGSVEYLVIGGGGSGGLNSSTRSGGGGGAGGTRTGSVSLSAGTYAITVGAGGIAQVVQDATSDGGSSSIGSTIISTGGGAGASVSGIAVNGRSGGSGGGGCSGGSGGVRTASPVQGNNGGSSGSSGSANAGTGGGAGAAGSSVNVNTLDGGSGLSSSITGAATTYAVGGGVRNDPDASVIPNTGRGGAGRFKGTTVAIGANGSPGIVVIRYSIAQPVIPPNISTTSVNLPTLRQKMAIYKNGVKFFHGNVTNIRSLIRGDSHEHIVTVSGPWWFLEKVPFTTQIQDGVGVSSERISVVFGTASTGQNLQTSIESAIDRAAAIGCPIATIAGGSSVESMHDFPRITLNQSSCGQTLSELVRLVPDAMVFFDYAFDPARIKVVRRPTCSTTTFDADTAPITSIDINPLIELEVQQVSLPAVTRNIYGLTSFNEQVSGTNPTGKDITKRQVLTIAGPELDTFLPNDLFDSQTIVKSTNYATLAHDSDGACVAAAKKAGLAFLPITIGGPSIRAYDRRYVYPFFSSTFDYYSINAFDPNDQKIVDSNGTELTNHSILTSGQPEDWTGIAYKEVTVSGTMIIIHYLDNGDSGGPGYQYFPVPAYIAEAGFVEVLSGFTDTAWSGDGFKVFYKPFSYSGYATPGAAGSSTVYKPADYSFINPPEGLANFLRETQSWIPYNGSIVIEEEDVGASRYAGTKVNITNSLSSFSDMGALVSGESIDILNGRTEIIIGAPPRNDYRTLVDKIRKTSQDNIVYV